MKQQEKTLPTAESLTLINESERLKRDIERPDMEKFRLFTQMLRTNLLLKKAIIRHK
ncbi:hypothetical protein [Mucilaginibacter sp.]|uniref:hypothetical protein n=1 Tax=Mucilaginibacter sp. TaxID=1882438 RepID=UPI0032652027